MKPTTLPGLPLVRHHVAPTALRAADTKFTTTGLGIMEVRFSLFDALYRISSWWEGDYMERVARGSFTKTFAERGPAGSGQVKTLFNHGQDMYIDQKLLGETLSLVEETDSPVALVDLWDTSYNRDLLPGIRAGAYGSSFMFQVLKEQWDEEPGVTADNPEGLPIRTIQEVRHFEQGPVTWPANPGATAGMRCMSGTDAYYEALRSRDPHRVEAMRSQVIALRSETPAASALVSVGAASQGQTEPAPATRSGMSAAARRARLYPFLSE